MKINKISKKMIKPHNPTPHNLKNYNVSFIDSYMVPMNFAVILFYTNQSKPQSLQESLAKTLVKFHPLAGRYIKNHHLIDCSDHGVEFLEAEALDIDLADLVAAPHLHYLNHLLPDHYFRAHEAADPLMSIQATHFLHDGGLAIAVSVFHKVFDGASLETFVAAWANSNSSNNVEIPSPSFHLPSLLPHKDYDFGVTSEQVSPGVNKIDVVKRLLFDRAAVKCLESRIRSTKKVTGVRVVCAFITKALIWMDRMTRGRHRDLVVLQPVNMRGRTVPPQPKHACRNLLVIAITRRVGATEVKGIEMEELVDIMGGAVRKSIGDHAEMFEIGSGGRDGRDVIIKNLTCMIKQVMDVEENVVIFTDWSKFGFNEADFGWGKSVWTCTGPQRPHRSSVVMMSNKEGDGIEAWVHLNQEDMRFFEQDEEIKFFTYYK